MDWVKKINELSFKNIKFKDILFMVVFANSIAVLVRFNPNAIAKMLIDFLTINPIDILIIILLFNDFVLTSNMSV